MQRLNETVQTLVFSALVHVCTHSLHVHCLFCRHCHRLQENLPAGLFGRFVRASLYSGARSPFFMYPCFRAATILEARNTLIHKVSLQPWEPGVKSRFLQFMKERRCGFVLSLVCVRLEFGFNVAYLSIFFGFIGIVIKVFSLT